MSNMSLFSRLLAKSIFVAEAGKLVNKVSCLWQEKKTEVKATKKKMVSLFAGINSVLFILNYKL